MVNPKIILCATLYGTDLDFSDVESEKSADELTGEEKYLRRMLELHWEYFSGTDSLYYDSSMISFPVNTHSLVLFEPVLRRLYYSSSHQSGNIPYT